MLTFVFNQTKNHVKMNKNPISRRDFLKDMGLVTGGALLASSPWLSAFAQEGDTAGEKVKIAMIGPGSRGQYHLNLLIRNPKAEVVAICDDYQPSIDGALKLVPNAKVYTDYRKMLEDPEIQGVFIVTPLFEHHRMAVDCLAAGKVLFVGQQRLFDPRYLRMIEMIRQGVIGDIQRINTFWYRNNDWRRAVPSPELERKINWRLYTDYSLGMMTELAGHQVQIGTWATGQIPNRVMGSGGNIFWKDGREVYDDIHVCYTFDDGRKMTFDSVISNKFYGLEEQILGHLGTIEPEKGKFFYETIPPAPGMMQLIHDVETSLFSAIPFAGPSWVPETANPNKGEYILGEKAQGDGSDLLSAAFVESCITGRQPANLVEEAYYATLLAILGDRAMREERIVDFPDEYKLDYLNHRAPVAEL